MKSNVSVFILAALCACNSPELGVQRDSLSDATEDTAVMYADERGRIEADGVEIKSVPDGFWQNVNWDAPVEDDADLRGSGVEKRADKKHTIFTMDDRVLFDTDKSEIREEGKEKLKQIANEIKQLPEDRQIRIYGHADSRASKDYNKDLSKDRAEAVKDWLKDNGDVKGSRLSIEAMGETDPRATNETAQGRQLNRRVAIVVAGDES